MSRPQRVLFVGTGAPGGIGRVDQLTAEAAASPQAPSDEMIALWRRTHPEYLRIGAIEQLATATAAPVGDGVTYVRALGKVLRAVRPDYVLYGHVNLARPAPWLRPVGHPARYAVWTYGIEIWNRLSWLHRHALASAETVLTISRDSAARTVETQGVRPERVRIIPLTLPDEMFAAASVTGEREPFRILTVSRLAKTEAGKNLPALLSAMSEVRQCVPQAQLTVVGDGDNKHDLEHTARELGVGDIVRFAGRLSDEELRSEYRNADLFVLPSEKEGFGLVFVEAMLAGTPVVGLAAGGPLDIVRDGVDGRLLPDISTLGQTVSDLLSDRPALERMRVEARDRALTEFSPVRFRESLAAAIASPD